MMFIYLKKYKATVIFMLVIMCTSLISIGIVLNTVELRINNSDNYENLDEFNFHAFDDNVKVEKNKNKATFTWDKIDNRLFYISSFNEGSINSIPSGEYLEKSLIEEGSKTMQIDIKAGGSMNYSDFKKYDVSCSVILYDTKGQTHTETMQFNFNSKQERSRNYSLKFDLNENDSSYRIIFRVDSKNEDNKGYFYFTDLDIIFS